MDLGYHGNVIRVLISLTVPARCLIKSWQLCGVRKPPDLVAYAPVTMYENADHGDLGTSEWLEARVENLPSSVILERSA